MTYDNIVLAVQDLSLSQISDLIAELEDLKEQKAKKAEQNLIEEMSEKAAKLGLSMDRILVQAKGAQRKQKSAAMYQNGDNTRQTWAPNQQAGKCIRLPGLGRQSNPLSGIPRPAHQCLGCPAPDPASTRQPLPEPCF